MSTAEPTEALDRLDLIAPTYAHGRGSLDIAVLHLNRPRLQALLDELESDTRQQFERVFPGMSGSDRPFTRIALPRHESAGGMYGPNSDVKRDWNQDRGRPLLSTLREWLQAVDGPEDAPTPIDWERDWPLEDRKEPMELRVLPNAIQLRSDTRNREGGRLSMTLGRGRLIRLLCYLEPDEVVQEHLSTLSEDHPREAARLIRDGFERLGEPADERRPLPDIPREVAQKLLNHDDQQVRKQAMRKLRGRTGEELEPTVRAER